MRCIAIRMAELDAYHGAKPAHLGDLRHGTPQSLQCFLQSCAKHIGARQQAFLFKNIEYRMSRCQSQRIAGVGTAQPAWRRRVHKLGASADSREWHAVSYTL